MKGWQAGDECPRGGLFDVVKPDGAPDWTIGGTIQFLFPK